MFFLFVCFYSIHWPLADVLLDRKFQNPWAVHSSMWSVCLLAFYPRGHCPAGVDATGTHCYRTQSPGVDTHGEHQWADWVVGKLWSWVAECCANWLLPFQLWHCVFVKWVVTENELSLAVILNYQLFNWSSIPRILYHQSRLTFIVPYVFPYLEVASLNDFFFLNTLICFCRSLRPLLWLCWSLESFLCYWACCLS